MGRTPATKGGRSPTEVAARTVIIPQSGTLRSQGANDGGKPALLTSARVAILNPIQGTAVSRAVGELGTERMPLPLVVTHETRKGNFGLPKKCLVPSPDFDILPRNPDTRVGVAIVGIQILPKSPNRAALPKG